MAIVSGNQDSWMDKIRELKAGDTLQLEPGIYSGGYDIDLIESGNKDARIKVAGNADGRGPAIFNEVGLNLLGNFWTFDNLKWENFSESPLKIGSGATEVNNIRLLNSSFEKGSARVVILANCRDVLIGSVLFNDINSGVVNKGAHAIDPNKAQGIRVLNSIFRDIGSDGIQLGGKVDSFILDWLVEGCLFEGCPVEVEWGEDGIDIKEVQGGIKIFKNTFRGFRPSARDKIGHSGGSPGTSGGCHVGAQGVHYRWNLFEDCCLGLVIADQTHKGFPPTKDILVEDNIFRNCQPFEGNDARPAQTFGAGLRLNGPLPESVIVRYNLFENCQNDIVADKASKAVVILGDPRPDPPVDPPVDPTLEERVDELGVRIEALQTALDSLNSAMVQAGLILSGGNSTG